MKLPKYRTVDGKKLTANKFAFVGDRQDPSTWRLPIHNLHHAERSLERLTSTNLPSFHFHDVRSRITAAIRKFISQES